MESLKEKYAPYFRIGAAFENHDLVKADLIKTHFNSMTCANAMKYGSLTRKPDEYNFDRADSLLAFAKENNIVTYTELNKI